MTYIIEEFAYVHDNQINAYHVDMAKKTLTLETVYAEKDKTDIVFTGLLAHHFDHVTDYNLIMGISQLTIDCYIDAFKDELEKSLPYAFPALFSSTDELKKHLIKESYNVYEITSSIGLCGIVIAKDISINATQNGEGDLDAMNIEVFEKC